MKTLLLGGMTAIALPSGFVSAEEAVAPAQAEQAGGKASAAPSKTDKASPDASAKAEGSPAQTSADGTSPKASPSPSDDAAPAPNPDGKAASGDVSPAADPGEGTSGDVGATAAASPSDAAQQKAPETDAGQDRPTRRPAGPRDDPEIAREDPDELKRRAIMGEEIDEAIEKATEQAVAEAYVVSGDADDPDSQRAMDQAIAEAMDEALEQVAERPLMGDPYHAPATRNHRMAALRNLRATSGLSGATGLLRTESAVLPSSGIVRLGLSGDFTGLSNFPTNGTDVTHVGARFTADYSFLDHFEGFLSYRIASDFAETAEESELRQTLGDFELGVKGSAQLFNGFYLGGLAKFDFAPGFGSGWDSGVGFQFIPEIIASWDARTANRDVPIVLHLNLGAIFTNQDDVYDDYSPSSFDEFALSINRYNRLAIAFGMELPLPWVTPYLEWNMALPITSSQLHSPDGKDVEAASAMDHHFTFGAKVTALPDVTFSAGFDFGLSGQVAKGVAPTPAFTFHLGITYAFDPLLHHRDDGSSVDVQALAISDRGPRVSEADEGEESADAAAESAAEGRSADKGGSPDQPKTPPAPAIGETAGEKDSQGAPKPPAAPIAASSDDGEGEDDDDNAPTLFIMAGGKAVDGRVVVLSDPSKDLRISAEGTKADLPAGTWKVAVIADGYLAQAKDLEIDGDGVRIDLTLDKPRPETPDVTRDGDSLKLSGKIGFMGQSSRLKTDVDVLLDQVADLMLTGKVEVLGIEAHTDNRGDKDALLQLSQTRADAVKAALESRGIPADRIQSKGFGDTKPIQANARPTGRAKNRRVELKVIK